MKKSKLIIIFFAVFSFNCYADDDIIFKNDVGTWLRPIRDNCNKINAASKYFYEEVSRRSEVRLSTIQFVKVGRSSAFGGTCTVIFDTEKGLKECLVQSIVKKNDNKKIYYMATGWSWAKKDDNEWVEVNVVSCNN